VRSRTWGHTEYRLVLFKYSQMSALSSSDSFVGMTEPNFVRPRVCVF
jgi:hypothetical protein